MTFTITRLKPFEEPPTDVGTLIVLAGRDGEFYVRVAKENGFETIYTAKLTDEDGLEQTIRWAEKWGGHRGADTIFVKGDLGA